MPPRLSPGYLALFLGLVISLVLLIQYGALTLAFERLGLSAESAYLLLVISLFGSLINLPLFTVQAEGPPQPLPPFLRGLLPPPRIPFEGKTLIAANLGGCVVPGLMSVHLMLNTAPNPMEHITAIAVVSVTSHLISRPIPGLGIGMPIFIAPINAALIAMLINPEHSAPLAYTSGTLGVLIGADLMRLKDIRQMGTPIASIGGAGTFDGIFITGIVAVLLT